MKEDELVMARYLRQLVGLEVTAVVRDPTHDLDTIWGLEFSDGKAAFILSDAEGNGAGHLAIQEAES